MKNFLFTLLLLPSFVFGQNYGTPADTDNHMGQGNSFAASNKAAFSAPTSIPSGLGGFSDPNAASQDYGASTSQGGLTRLGEAKLAQCANYVPGSNALLDQQCGSVNFLANNCLTANSGQQAIIGNRTAANANGVNCTGSYGSSSVANSPYVAVNGVTNANATGSAQQVLALGNIYSSANDQTCSVQNITTANAQYSTYQCTKSNDTNQVSCTQDLATTVTTNRQTAIITYSCSGGTIVGQYCQASSDAPAPIHYSCAAGQTLSGSNCINPNGSVLPASIASYGCPEGQSLQGATCVATNININSANTNYSCPAGQSVSGSNCISTSTTTANANFTCASIGGSFVFLIRDTTTCSHILTYLATHSYYCDATAYSSRTNSEWVLWGQDNNMCTYAGKDPENGGNQYQYWDFVPAYVETSCDAGDSLSGNACTKSFTTSATIGSYSCNSPAVLSGNSCVTTTTSAANVTYSCNSGGVLSGSQCAYTTTSTSAATPNYSCPSGYSLSGTSCVGPSTIAATINYTCPTGATLSGSGANSICTTVTTTPANVNYSCANGSAPQYGQCIIYTVTSAWQDNCTAYEQSAGSFLGSP